ncbi:MAG: hypothetical protein U9R02_01455, partial [Thermodesulfobacteriota bacterium]|nr:hypothetical protein [Thermodesulfobacteriota bacterium]
NSHCMPFQLGIFLTVGLVYISGEADGIVPKKRRIRTKFKEYTIEIFQWKKKKKIVLVGF